MEDLDKIKYLFAVYPKGDTAAYVHFNGGAKFTAAHVISGLIATIDIACEYMPDPDRIKFLNLAQESLNKRFGEIREVNKQ